MVLAEHVLAFVLMRLEQRSGGRVTTCVAHHDMGEQVGLRFALPPRENPADVLMDIIGGKVARQGDPGWVCTA
jgi:hypothetical protein